MRPSITEIAEAFSRHKFEETYPYMLDDVEWTLVGEKQLRGKATIVGACQESANYLATVRTTFGKFKVVTGEACVVVDSRAEYTDSHGESSDIASCDIYDFASGSLAAITSYTLALSSGRPDGAMSDH